MRLVEFIAQRQGYQEYTPLNILDPKVKYQTIVTEICAWFIRQV